MARTIVSPADRMQGLYQIKYLYGSHIYSWGPEQLSYYISFMGGGRALFLLIVFPCALFYYPFGKKYSNAPQLSSRDSSQSRPSPRRNPSQGSKPRNPSPPKRISRARSSLTCAWRVSLFASTSSQTRLSSSRLRRPPRNTPSSLLSTLPPPIRSFRAHRRCLSSRAG